MVAVFICGASAGLSAPTAQGFAWLGGQGLGRGKGSGKGGGVTETHTEGTHTQHPPELKGKYKHLATSLHTLVSAGQICLCL